MKEMKVFISEKPEEPEKQEEWIKSMSRIQYVMWINSGAKCEVCGKRYESVDDFVIRKPRCGFKKQGRFLTFIDDKCYDKYIAMIDM